MAFTVREALLNFCSVLMLMCVRFADILRKGLRIHEETERGDNDTVKTGNGQTVKIDGKTCADR